MGWAVTSDHLEQPLPRLQFRLLGSLELEVDGTLADLGGPHQRAILALLLLQRNRPVQRNEIIDRVWGPEAPATAPHAVEVYISKLRRWTDPGAARADHQVLRSTPGGYTLRVPERAVDVEAFEDLLRLAEDASRGGDPGTAARLAAVALALWRGPALAGLRDFGFAAAAADRLEDLRAAAVEHQARAVVARGEPGAALQDLGRLVAENPLRENLVAQLMIAKRDVGDLAGAMATYHRARRALLSELGLQPSETLRALAAEIVNTGVSGGPERATRIPLPSQAVIGRENDIAEVVSLVRQHSMVTLTGFPGVGKSTIAAEACRRLQDEFDGAVFTVDLAMVRDGRDIPDHIARSLGLQDQSARRTIEVVRAHLAERRALVVFDNCEHLQPAMREGAERRDGTPGVHYVFTSVVPIGADGEVVFRVGPLSLPATMSRADMQSSGAVALLRDRLMTLNSEFELHPREAEAIFRLCHRLEGLPLAIELAAAQAKVHSLAELADVLDRDLSLVSTHPAASNPARRSLNSALESAYGALGANERRLVVAAATFRGAINIDMLLDVAALPRIRRERQLELVDELVTRAILARTTVGAHPRLRMLEATRAFILRKTRADTAAACRLRYIERFAGECEIRVVNLERDGQVPALEWLDVELDNVRAALRGLLDGGAPGRALALVGGLGRFWWVRGHLTEGRRWLREVLEANPAPTNARAEALRVLAYLEWSQGEVGAAEGHCLQALELAQALGDQRSLARSFYYLGVAQHALDRLDDARANFRRALAAVRALPDPPLEGLILDMLARALTSSGRHGEGRGASEKSLSLLKAAGDAFGVAVCLTNLAEAQVRDGEVETARAAYVEALQRFRALHCVVGEGYALQGLAWVAALVGEREDARRLVGEMHECWDVIGYVPTREDEERNAEILARDGAT